MNEQQTEALRLADRIDLKDYYEFDASLHCQKAAAELRRLHQVELALKEWISKTEWVQESSEAEDLGRHRADVMKQRIDRLHDENEALRAALEQPQNHVPDAGNMGTVGWKLVPVEPNCSMVLAGERSLEQHDFLRLDSAYRAMLAAAPQPPEHYDQQALDMCLTCGWKTMIPGDCCLNCARQRPQANQPAMTPIAQRKLDDLVAGGYTISGYSVYHERRHQHGFVTGAGLVGWWRPEGLEYPQPQGEQEPFAWISPRALEWGTRQSEKVVKLTCKAQPEYDFTEPLYTHPQNLRCKSNQARLATLWGYVKAGQPQGEQDPVAWVWFDANKKPCSVTFGGPNINTPKDWGVSPLYTRPQPKREPLTDEQLDAIVFGCGLSRTARDIARAIEAAHNIK